MFLQRSLLFPSTTKCAVSSPRHDLSTRVSPQTDRAADYSGQIDLVGSGAPRTSTDEVALWRGRSEGLMAVSQLLIQTTAQSGRNAAHSAPPQPIYIQNQQILREPKTPKETEERNCARGRGRTMCMILDKYTHRLFGSRLNCIAFLGIVTVIGVYYVNDRRAAARARLRQRMVGSSPLMRQIMEELGSWRRRPSIPDFWTTLPRGSC